MSGKRTKYLTQMAMMPQHPGSDLSGFDNNLTGSYNEDEDESGSQGLVMISPLDQ